MTSRGRQHSQAGFTLVEVVLAVAVLALAMVTLGQTLGASAVAYRNIDDTRQAYLVAADKLVEMQVYQQWPSTGTTDSEVNSNGRDWWIETTVSEGLPATHATTRDALLILASEVFSANGARMKGSSNCIIVGTE